MRLRHRSAVFTPKPQSPDNAAAEEHRQAEVNVFL
jgi:hypothetical protein